MFDRLINITVPDRRGIIDKAELETIITCKGNTIMLEIEPGQDVNYILSEKLKHLIFTPHENGCKYIGLSLVDEMNVSLLEGYVGVPLDTFTGYNKERNFIVVAGMAYPKRRIEKLIYNIQNRQQDIRIADQEIEIEVPKLNGRMERKETRKGPIDINAIFGKYGVK